MCVRTKTSYGCGHIYKTTTECYSSRCQGLERYHYPKDTDCRSCKTGGNTVTRGRDGKGRYAQEISKRSITSGRSPLQDPSEESIPSFDNNETTNSWETNFIQEKLWHSPTRKKADDAWLEEHETRMSDLQDRMERFGVSTKNNNHNNKTKTTMISIKPFTTDDDLDHHDDHTKHRRHRHKHSHNEKNERFEDANEEEDDDDDDDYTNQRRRDATEKSLQYEIRRINRQYQPSSLSRSPQTYTNQAQDRQDRHRRHPQDSYESFESMSTYNNSRSKSHNELRHHSPLATTTTAKVAYSHHAGDDYDQYDSGYGSYSSRRSQQHRSHDNEYQNGQDYTRYKYKYKYPRSRSGTSYAGDAIRTEPYLYSPPPPTFVVPTAAIASSPPKTYNSGYGVPMSPEIVTRSPNVKYRRW